MRNISTFKIGDAIRKARIELGITQEQLAEGICSVSSLSKIENNIQVPSKANFDALMQRMGKSSEIYYAFVSERDFDIQEMKQKVGTYITLNDFDEAEKLIEVLENEIDASEGINKQFILFTKAIIGRYKGDDLSENLKLLYQAINITIPNFNERKLSNYLLTDEDVRIINNIAISHYWMNNKRNAIRLLYDLKEYIEESYNNTKSKIDMLPLILYNLSKWLGLEKRYEEAIEICDIGIRTCIQHGRLRYFGELLVNRACDLYDIGNKEESLKTLKKAYFVLIAEEYTKDALVVKKYAMEKFQICFDDD